MPPDALLPPLGTAQLGPPDACPTPDTIVLLECGHWFREHRPAKAAKPRQGELRACGHPEHYPNQYPATYVVKAAQEEVMSSEPEHLGGGKYANWYIGPARKDGLTRQRLQITDPHCLHSFDMLEAQALYRFLESHYGWMLGHLTAQES